MAMATLGRSKQQLWSRVFLLSLVVLTVRSGIGWSAAKGDVVVNEFMANNTTTVADQNGQYDDWIELYNKSSSDVSLTGWYLTDDSAVLTKWTFPEASIPAGAYLIVWADEDTAQPGLHAAFKLSASGESMVLASPDQTIMDQVTFGAQTADLSMARSPNGTGEFIQMNPTFSAANVATPGGDINGNSAVSLEDAILALQVMVGLTPSATVHVEADVNNDKRIGLEETVYILRKASVIEISGHTTNQITLKDNSTTVDGTGATVNGNNVTITSAGTYNISGSLTDGQIVVNTGGSGTVSLVLNGVTIGCSTGAPISIVSADKAEIVLSDNTDNTITDSANYVFPDAATDEPNAAVFSKADLTISGKGSLTVNGNYNDGIAGKDGLTIAGGTIAVNSVDDGIRGKDYLIVKGGNITVKAKGDGLKSDNAEDAATGYISVEAGTLNITAGGDGLDAETTVTITDGTLVLSTGGGSSGVIAADASAKGIKGTVGVTIAGGTITVDSADDAIHSNGTVTINGGTFLLSTGDDGVHADASITINDGNIDITKSYEGIESAVITIKNGNIRIVSSDDGVNIAGGNDGSGVVPGPGITPGHGGIPGQDTFTTTNYWLYINGGRMVVTANGDGIDANGGIEMTDGVVIVNGPTANDNAALDYDASFKKTGGYLVAAGSSGMAMAPSNTSTQNSVLINFNSVQPANSLIHIQNDQGGDILTFAPSKTYQSVTFSSSELKTGSTYTVYLGGSSTGTAADGVYQNGTYTPGTQYTSFTVSGVVTTVGGNSPPHFP